MFLSCILLSYKLHRLFVKPRPYQQQCPCECYELNDSFDNKLNMFNLFRHCRKDEFSFDIVAVCGNKVECCFDKVERCFYIVAGGEGA